MVSIKDMNRGLAIDFVFYLGTWVRNRRIGCRRLRRKEIVMSDKIGVTKREAKAEIERLLKRKEQIRIEMRTRTSMGTFSLRYENGSPSYMKTGVVCPSCRKIVNPKTALWETCLSNLEPARTVVSRSSR